MVPVAIARFERALGGARRVGVDTVALIYHLEDVTPYSDLTTHLLSRVARRDAQLLLSVITVSEVLAGSWLSGDRVRAENLEAALRGLPGIVFAGVNTKTAVKAAEIRGRTKLPLPDALIIASTAQEGATVLVTNDAAWKGRTLPCRIVLLDDFIGRA